MKYLLTLLVLLLSINSYSQNDTIKPKKSSDIQLGINLAGGNNPFYGGSIKAGFSYEHHKWEFAFAPNFNLSYASTGGDVKLVRREGYNASSVSYKFNDTYKIIGFNEVDHSYIRKINLRWNVGIGAGAGVETQKINFNISEVILAEGLQTMDNSVSDYFVLRASTRIKFIFKTNFGSLSTVTLVQPAIFTNQGIPLAEHFILRSQNRLEFNISKSLSTGLTYDANLQRYPSHLNSSVLPFDWGTTYFIVYKITK